MKARWETACWEMVFFSGFRRALAQRSSSASESGSKRTSAPRFFSACVSFLRPSASPRMAKTVTQLAGGSFSQSSTRAASLSSSRALPPKSGAQSRTSTMRRSHMKGSVSAASMICAAVAPFEHRLVELFQPRGQQRAPQRPQRLALEVFLRPG